MLSLLSDKAKTKWACPRGFLSYKKIRGLSYKTKKRNPEDKYRIPELSNKGFQVLFLFFFS